MANDNRKPIGDSIRDMINSALDDPRRKEIQLDCLNHVFEAYAMQFTALVQRDFTSIFNEASSIRKPGGKNEFIIRMLTETDQQGQPGYSPVKQIRIPISTNFTDFTAAEINNLPGYII